MKTIPFNKLYLGLIILVTLPLCLKLWGGGLIDGHDAMAGLIRALCMNAYMGHGQWLVRWAPDVNLGYGYPMFNFYPPLFSFVAVVFFKMTHQMVWSIDLACALFWILSGVGMFLLAREFWGDEGGVVSAVLYVYAPYHIIDLYIRGAFAEFSAFAFFPFLLLAVYKTSRNPSTGHFLLGTASVCGLVLAHNIMNMLFLPVAVLFMFYLFFFDKKGRWVFSAAGFFIVGLLLSAFFWLPALTEKGYLNLNFLIGKHYDFHENFISLRKLFWPFHVWTMDHISFQVGVVHTLFGLGSLGLLPQLLKTDAREGRFYLFFLGVAVITVLFTLPCSVLFWEHLSLLDFVQFPWRFLTLVVFAVSMVCGALSLLFKSPVTRRIFMVLAVLIAVLYYEATCPKLKFLPKLDSIQDFIALGEGEYTPKWVQSPPLSRPDRKFELVQGHAELGAERMINPVDYKIKIQALSNALVCFHTFYFPGWKVLLDQHPVNPYWDNPYGLVLFSVPQGEHKVEVVFGSTSIRTAGVGLTCLGVLLLVVIIV